MSLPLYNNGDNVVFLFIFIVFTPKNSNNNYTRQWRDELTLENHDLPGKETWGDTWVTENEQVKMPTKEHQGSPVWSNIIALKKSDGSYAIQDS